MQAPNRDEAVSWGVATVLMEIATAFTVAMRILGMDPFTTFFDVFVVYIPTAVLVNSMLFGWVKHSSSAGVDSTASSAPENKAV